MRAVSQLLLRRLGEELRAVEILAERGHGFQSATAACNLFEQSHYLTYVGISEDDAKKFIEWTDPHKSIIHVKALVDASGPARGWMPERCEAEYDKYRFLCGFKHNNPIFQRILGLPTDPDLFMAQYAVAESVWNTLSAVGLFAAQFLSIENIAPLLEEVNPIMDEVSLLFPVITETK